jgi:hypothetical protein
MINHVRTLILNRRASSVSDAIGYEYIEPTFNPVTLPAEFGRIHKVLVPGGLDNFGQHDVIGRLLQLAHHVDLEPYVLAMDPRITYQLDSDVIAKAADKTLTVKRSKSADCDMTLHYAFLDKLSADHLPPGVHKWQLTDGNVESITVKYGDQDGELFDIVPRNATRSVALDLVPGYLSVYFDLPTQVLTGHYNFEFELRVAVNYDLGDILERLVNTLARPGYDTQLFKPWGPYADQLNNLRDTWRNSPEAPLRLGAVVLSLALQMQHIREQ